MNWQQFFGIPDAAIFTSGNLALFRLNICISYRCSKIFTKFREGWSNSKEMATVFRNPIWQHLMSVLLFDIRWCVMYRIRIVPTNFGRVGKIEMNWQPFFVNQDGDSRHIELWSLCYFSTQQIRSTSNPQHCHHIWQHVSEIQDSGNRHNELW